MKKVLFAMMFFMLLCIWFALYQNGVFTTAKAIDGIELKKKINYDAFTNNFYIKEKYWKKHVDIIRRKLLKLLKNTRFLSLLTMEIKLMIGGIKFIKQII